MTGRRKTDRALEAAVRAALGHRKATWKALGPKPAPRPKKTPAEKQIAALQEEARREQLVRRCRLHGLPDPIFEHRFHPSRKWRLDLAWPEHQVAGEIEGGAFTRGRHTRGAGFVKDMEKYNALAAAGWRLVRGTPKQVKTGAFFRALAEVFSGQ
jgi:hypothetical protein